VSRSRRRRKDMGYCRWCDAERSPRNGLTRGHDCKQRREDAKIQRSLPAPDKD